MQDINDFLHEEIKTIRADLTDLGLKQGLMSGSVDHILKRVGRLEVESVTKEALNEFKNDALDKLKDIEDYVKEARTSRKIWRWIGGAVVTVCLGMSTMLFEKIEKIDIKLDQNFIQVGQNA